MDIAFVIVTTVIGLSIPMLGSIFMDTWGSYDIRERDHSTSIRQLTAFDKEVKQVENTAREYGDWITDLFSDSKRHHEN